MRYDVPKIKTEIKLLARALRENKLAFKQAQRDEGKTWGLIPSAGIAEEFEAAFAGDREQLRQFRSPGLKCWLWSGISIYFTRLCALRASMRGRLHFSPNTKPATVEDLGIEWPLTLEDQREWAECIAARFELEDMPLFPVCGINHPSGGGGGCRLGAGHDSAGFHMDGGGRTWQTATAQAG